MSQGEGPAPSAPISVQQKEQPADPKEGAHAKKVYVGRHKFRVNSCEFDVDRKYYPMKVLGEGAYGVVCLAENRESKERLAIKKCTKAFQDVVDAKRILREIKLLRHLAHPHIISTKDLIPPRELGYIEDVYIVMSSMEANLHKIIYSKQRLSNEHIQYFIFQTLKGLKYLHSAGVIHRDIKPSNLLVNHDCDLKICDFGLARGFQEAPDAQYTEYVVTRHYRAPEVMTNAKRYDERIDVWAVGCVFAELMGRRPLFPGSDYLEQLRLIISKVGSPDKEDLEAIPTPAARSFIESLGKVKKTPWKQLFPGAPDLALDLLDKLLAFNPKKRITVSQALKHPYFKSLYRDGDPAMADCPTPFDFSWEQKEFDEKRIQDLMWEEIFYFRPDLREERRKGIEAGTIRPYERLRIPESKNVDEGNGRRDSVAAAAAAAEAAGRAELEERRKNIAAIEESGGSISAPVAAAPAAVSVSIAPASEDAPIAVPAMASDVPPPAAAAPA
jgi:mitogen-activated protein kinase 1/3